MVTLRLFAQARESVGQSRLEFDTSNLATVGDVLDAATAKHGSGFSDVLAMSKVWLNGQPVERSASIVPGDEVAVLPPVSGG